CTESEARILQAFQLGLFDTFARWTDGWHLLGGQSAKRFGYQVRLPIDHCFPTGCLHNVGGMTRKKQCCETRKTRTGENLRVDKFDCMRLQLIRTMHIGED